MDKEKAIKILLFFSTIDKEVGLNRRIINDLEEKYYPTPGASRIDGMPKAKGRASSPTEAVLNVPDSVYNTMRELERQNERLCKLKSEILKEMNGLNHTGRAVVYAFYIEGQRWEQISERLNYSERQCKNIRSATLERLAIRFERNKTISAYSFPA